MNKVMETSIEIFSLKDEVRKKNNTIEELKKDILNSFKAEKEIEEGDTIYLKNYEVKLMVSTLTLGESREFFTKCDIFNMSESEVLELGVEPYVLKAVCFTFNKNNKVNRRDNPREYFMDDFDILSKKADNE